MKILIRTLVIATLSLFLYFSHAISLGDHMIILIIALIWQSVDHK